MRGEMRAMDRPLTNEVADIIGDVKLRRHLSQQAIMRFER